MNIVVIDCYTLNPGDLSWRPLEALGHCTFYERTDPKDIVARAKNADIILTNKVVFSSDIIDHLPNLKYIGVTATGYNIVDTEAARKKNIPVTNVPAYSTQSVAQMAFAHLLNLALHIGRHALTVRQGKWFTSPDFCYWETPLIELAGLTMGIIGLGQTGTATAKLARAFGMNVIVHTRTIPSAPPVDCRFVQLDDLFQTSDVVSLHCPLTDQTENIVNRRRLSLMKRSAFLINTGRGQLIDEPALADALNNNQIAGAGLDVLCSEPPEKDNPLIRAKNCCITPHIAWASRAARRRLLSISTENVAAYLRGKPQNVVSNV